MTINRVPPGVPTGGQFAEGRKGESATATLFDTAEAEGPTGRTNAYLDDELAYRLGVEPHELDAAVAAQSLGQLAQRIPHDDAELWYQTLAHSPMTVYGPPQHAFDGTDCRADPRDFAKTAALHDFYRQHAHVFAADEERMRLEHEQDLKVRDNPAPPAPMIEGNLQVLGPNLDKRHGQRLRRLADADDDLRAWQSGIDPYDSPATLEESVVMDAYPGSEGRRL